jgi:hypothetical protein
VPTETLAPDVLEDVGYLHDDHEKGDEEHVSPPETRDFEREQRRHI